MICTKEFIITVDGECINLAADAEWTYNPNASPNQPPAGLIITDEFEGYYGEWEGVKAGAPDLAVAPVFSWRVQWTGAVGPTLRVTCTIVGSVNRVGLGLGANIICRSNANATVVTSTQLCPAGVVTDVNLTAVANRVLTGGVTAASCNHQIPADGTYSLSGTVIVECV